LEAVKGIPHQRFQWTHKMRVCQDFHLHVNGVDNMYCDE